MDCFIIPVNTLPLQNIFSRSVLSKKIYTRYSEKVLKKYTVYENGITNSVVREGFAGVQRSAAYIAYRRYSDTKVIRISSSLLWIRINNGLLIGDMEIAEGEFDKVMDILAKLAVKLGTKQIQFHTSTGTALHKHFMNRYPVIPSFPVIFKVLNEDVLQEKIKFTFADIDIF